MNCTELSDSDEIFSCPDCDKVFKKASNLYAHVRSTHTIRVTICSFCSKEFKNKDLCRQHEKLVHVSLFSGEQHVCDICSKAFKSTQNLYWHKNSVHAESDSFCEICGTKCKNEYALKKHVRRCVNKAKDAPIGRPKLEKAGNHILSPGFENAYYCQDCDITFM